MKKLLILLALILALTPIAQADDKGMISKKSQYSVKVTLDRLEEVLTKKGITIVTRWSHSDGAKKVGIPLRDTELLIFGNPKLGSHFFTSSQTAGIDLPMKALAWKDAKGQVWLTYNDPQYMADRHGINDRPEIVKKMTGALNKLSNVATGNK
ncbi:DUF302 domain-containing protein [sulfur-oxidizing endosymbiont of Gigantopelta aegis]|uniref:DUF302 domain-containing protein n=1 Tax=sulfur-oxidizing endosymbiont of Gigantopelta aegis TaxID=2794934 RepID=UPI0018DDEE2C|nr:DUF302 domain-containing protein [sulfur-oxidizing endosymbiont of Gigantopelta aegis]